MMMMMMVVVMVDNRSVHSTTMSNLRKVEVWCTNTVALSGCTSNVSLMLSKECGSGAITAYTAIVIGRR